MFLTKDNSYVRLRINGVEVDFDRVTFKHITQRTHVLYDFPMLNAEIYDPTEYFTAANMPSDGTLIEVAMGRNSSDAANWVPYRAFRPEVDNQSTSQRVLRLSCYFNAPRFLFEQVNFSHSGSAASVVQRVGALADIPVEADATSDVMTWLCASGTLIRFLRAEVTPHAYSEPSSAYGLCFSHVSQSIKFRNVARIVKSNPKYRVSDSLNTSPDHLIHESRAEAMSGLMNTAGGGYGMSVTGYSVMTGQSFSHSGVEVNRGAGSLNMNSKMASAKTRQIYAPLDFGNTHENYARAQGQNLRILGTYSQSQSLLFREFTPIDVFDPIEVRLQRMMGKTDHDDHLSANYVVTGKAQIVTPEGYAENVSCTRNSIDVTNGELV